MLATSIATLPGATIAASPLALKRSDYPHAAKLAIVPATNEEADHYLAPAHNSTFEHLHRLDGAGWLQFATWNFKTGAGSASIKHQTIFGYGINLFRRSQGAKRALADVKLPTRLGKVAHLTAHLFTSSSVDRTLVFAFLAYKTIEIEAYYEYAGVAPSTVAKRLRHTFSRQLSHLVHLAHTVGRVSITPTPIPPTATDTATATSTATPTVTVSPTPSSTATSLPVVTLTATPTIVPSATPSPTSSPLPTPTSSPIILTVQAAMSSPSYAPGMSAVVNVSVTANNQPIAGVLVHVSFGFDAGPRSCDSRTDASGLASCSVVVPHEIAGTTVRVSVQVVGVDGQSAFAATSFTVGTQ